MTKQDSTIEYNNGRAGFFICNRFYRTAIEKNRIHSERVTF